MVLVLVDLRYEFLLPGHFYLVFVCYLRIFGPKFLAKLVNTIHLGFGRVSMEVDVSFAIPTRKSVMLI